MTASRFGDLYFSIPPANDDGPDPAPVPLTLAFSLAGARRGEIVPVDVAGVTVPRDQKELRVPGAIFRRIRVRHTWQTAYQPGSEVIEAWQRV